ASPLADEYDRNNTADVLESSLESTRYRTDGTYRTWALRFPAASWPHPGAAYARTLSLQTALAWPGMRPSWAAAQAESDSILCTAYCLRTCSRRRGRRCKPRVQETGGYGDYRASEGTESNPAAYARAGYG